MSVLIKGIGIPESCAECRFCVNGFTDDAPMYECACESYENVSVLVDDNGQPFDFRPEWCPLVEVPTPHGRLIDADAFATNLKDISVRQGYKNTLIDEHLTVDDVFDSIIDELTGKAIYGFEYNPTIIEAEGSNI